MHHARAYARQRVSLTRLSATKRILNQGEMRIIFGIGATPCQLLRSQYLMYLLGYVDVLAASCSACPTLDLGADGKDAEHVNYHLVFTLWSMNFLYSTNPRTSSHDQMFIQR